MKKIIGKYGIGLLSAMLLCIGLISCRDENNEQQISLSAPEIQSISASLNEDGQPSDLSPAAFGYAGNTYVIQGSGFSTLQKISFNGKEAVFNPNLVTDNTIFVTIHQDTPYADASNKVQIVTKYGQTEYDFVVAPPAPVFDSYNSINPQTGDLITLYGNYFLDPVVKIGEQEVEVVSSTLTEIKARVPADAMHKLVSVTTMSGTATAPQAIGSALYDDALQGDAGHWTWSGNAIVTDHQDDAAQGVQSMKIAMGGWDGADFKFTPRDVTPYKAFRIRIKSMTDNPDAKLVLVFGGWAYQITKSVGSDWTSIEIPFSEIGNPTTFDQITFQEAGNFGGNTLLIDDMGFVLK